MIKINKYYYDKMLFEGAPDIDKFAFYEPNYSATSGDIQDPEIKRCAALNESIALDFLRYALEYYLEWTPQYAMDHLDAEMLEKLHLKGVMRTRVRYPEEVKSDDSPWVYYLICKAYPAKFKYDKKGAIIEHYKKNYLTTTRYASKFFSDTDEGRERARICLWYALKDVDGRFQSVAEMYNFFLENKGEASSWLKEKKLNMHCENNYENAIEFLHASVPPEMDDENAYNECVFTIENRLQRKIQRKLKLFNKK